MFAWLRTKHETAEPNSAARDTVDHASAHALAFVTANVPTGLDDEDLGFLLAQGFLTAGKRSLSPGHAEVAAQALRELYPEGVPKSRTRAFTAKDGRTTSDRKAFGAPDSHSFRGEAAP